jgi:HD-GYP domain-containing protein (c-di-GMP phosphodiesterase class II)
MFRRDLVDAFTAISSRESFWFGITADDLESSLRRRLSSGETPLSVDDILCLGEIATRIIDYKSAFTATHSRGVAATAATLSRIQGFDDDESRVMHFAGLLHDIGKLAVPSEIIEKQASLTDGETNRMRSHAYYTWKAFERFRGMDETRAWAAYHHEHLDGSGYPFHLKGEQLSVGSRILAVADIYTALTEDRPYRPGMDPEDAVGLLRTMVQKRFLDAAIVSTLSDNVRAVDSTRGAAQEEAADSFRALHLAV